MLDNTFKFYLKKDASTYYAVQNGQVVETTTKTPLKHAPAGWADIELKYQRSSEFYGVFRKYALDLRFVLDAAQILRHVYFKQGWNATPIFYAEKLNTTTLVYSFFFESNIDISHTEFTEDYVGAPLIDRNGETLITNNKDTRYQFKTSPTTGISIDGFTMGGTIKWTPICYFPEASMAVPTLNLLSRTSNIGKDYIPDTVPGFGTDNSTDYSNLLPSNFMFSSTLDGTAKITVSDAYFKKLYSSSAGSTYAYIKKIPNIGTAVNYDIGILSDAGNPSADYGELQVISWTQEIPVAPGDKIFLIVGPHSGIFNNPGITAYTSIENLNGNNALVQMEYGIRVPATLGIGSRYVDFVKGFVDKMTNGQYQLQSDFLSNPDTSAAYRAANYDNSPYNTLVFSAYDILYDDPQVRVSLSSIIKDVFGRWMCGMGIEGGNIVIEPLTYFFNKNIELFSVSEKEVQSITIHPYNEETFKLIQVGYKPYDDDQLGQTNESNTGFDFLFDNIKDHTAQTKDLRSDFRADIFGIEWLRQIKGSLEYQNKPNNPMVGTVDDSRFEGIFLIEYDPSTAKPYRPPGTITGFHDIGEPYNLTLSPKRSLMRLMPYIKSLLPDGVLKFQSADKNPDVESSFFAGDIIENEDVDVATVNASPLFRWEIIEAVVAPPYNLIEQLNGNLNGYISINYKGINIKGFIMEIGIKPAIRDKYTFKLLSHPDNNLDPLIKHF